MAIKKLSVEVYGLDSSAAKKITFNIAYTKINNNALKNLFILHGWGSNKELMNMAFSKTLKDFNHFYIDLCGFGESDYGLDSSEVPLSTRDYANIIDSFIASVDCLDSSLNTIMGHSFGGKVAMLVNNADNVILLSSAGILTPKSFKTKTKIALAKIAKKFKLNASFLKSKDAENLNKTMYETFKFVVNEDFSDVFKNSNKNVSIFWGENDLDTPLSSGLKIHSLIKDSRFFSLSGDHYFFLKQGDKIANLLESNLESKLDSNDLHIIVTGKVQGVGYRKFAKKVADKVGIMGSVRNLNDGSVEIFASHKLESVLKAFIEDLKIGPSRGEVKDMKIRTLRPNESCSKNEFLILK